MLGGDVFILKVGSFFEGLLEQLVGGIRERGLRRLSGNLGKLIDLAIDIAEHGLRAYADFFEHGRHDAFLILKQGGEQVYRQQLGVTVLRGKLVRALDGFLRFYSEFVPTDWHGKLLNLVIGQSCSSKI